MPSVDIEDIKKTSHLINNTYLKGLIIKYPYIVMHNYIWLYNSSIIAAPTILPIISD